MNSLIALQRVQGVRKNPLMVEFQVSPETAPYLVTSSDSLMWIETPHPNNVVKAAVRQVGLNEMFQEIIREVVSKGVRRGWGNVHPLTEAGLRGAVEHVKYYELGDVELMVPTGIEGVLEEVCVTGKFEVTEDTWIPEDTIIVVPKDRGFVGLGMVFEEGLGACLVHNAARGIAVATKMA